MSVDEVVHTLYEATGLVVIVVIVFLQTWRAAIIPIVAIPVSLIGCFLMMSGLGLTFNTLSLLGLVLAIGIVVDDAIVVVENAEAEEQGKTQFEAAVLAARTRLRPILMTSFVFILGVLPLAGAQGAGAEMRQSLGTAVFAGMLGVTFFGLVFTPTFYVLVRWLSSFLRRHTN
jgi:multidrug efflux pump subunit AcrB